VRRRPRSLEQIELGLIGCRWNLETGLESHSKRQEVPAAYPMIAPESAQIPGAGLQRRFGFRFTAAYLLIYNAAAVFALLPWIGRYEYYLNRLWNFVVLWTERVVLRMTTLSSLKVSGSGDTSFLWMKCACTLVLALAAAVIWSSLDRDRRREPVVRDFVRVCVRYCLAATLLSYGIDKLVPPGQFPAPSGARLLETVGRLSPMRMLWVFMGASTAYKSFSAIMEIFGGVLLLLRRTTPLGSVVAAGVILNIVLLNFCYDVPVKLYSLNLLLMAGFLAWPDLRRISNVLILNRPADAASLIPPWKSVGFRLFAMVLKVAVIGALFFGEYKRIHGSGPEFRPVPPAVAQLSGIWNVDSFKQDGVVVPPLITDENRWRRVIFENFYGDMRLIASGENNQWLGFWLVGPDSSDGKLVLRDEPKQVQGAVFVFSHPGQDRLQLTGMVKGHVVVVDLERANADDTRLLNRGFHWISEVPFNR
jgi:uncharacterized membrane protein YphA (DoxX/SURF4 family)